MKLLFAFFLLLLLLLLLFVTYVPKSVSCSKDDRLFLTNVPVANVRSEKSSLSVSFEIDASQLTQLLFNEPVVVSEITNDGWAFVEAVMQQKFVNGSWQGYPGWVEMNALVKTADFPLFNLVVSCHWCSIFKRPCVPFGCLSQDIALKVSMGTYLVGVEENPMGWWKLLLPDQSSAWISSSDISEIQFNPKSITGDISSIESSSNFPFRRRELSYNFRAELLSIASSLSGWYYFWGGRSIFNAEMFDRRTMMTGVDCSGLVSLTYKSMGLLLPRDAHDIFLKSKNVTMGPNYLLPGDLLFLSRNSYPYHMYHVMLVYNQETIVESSADTGIYAHNATRIVSTMEKFGIQSLADASWAFAVPSSGSLLFWGTYFPWERT